LRQAGGEAASFYHDDGVCFAYAATGKRKRASFFAVNISRLRDNSFRIGYPCWREKLQKGPEAKARSLEHEAFYGAERTNTGKYRFVF